MTWYTEPTGVNPKHPCRACNRTIAKTHRNLTCLTCNYRIHIKCNNTEPREYNKVSNKIIETCLKCLEDSLPFQTLSDELFHSIISTEDNNTIITDPLNQVVDDTKYCCRACNRTIAKNHRKLQCKSCNSRIHLKCNNTDPKIYSDLPKKEVDSCLKCLEESLPFHTLEDQNFSSTLGNSKKNADGQKDDNHKVQCISCRKTIAKNHRKLNCLTCKNSIHIKCNNTDSNMYNKLKKKEIQLCQLCLEDSIPFQKLDDESFDLAVTKGINHDLNDLSMLFPSDSLKIFFKESNNFADISSSDEEENEVGIDCKYVDIESFNHKQKKNNLSFFHLNIASLSKHKEELDTVLSLLGLDFDFIGITETKIKKKSTPIIDIDKSGYNHYSTPTEGEKGGTLLYISNKFDSKARSDLEKVMYKSNQIESTFREIINKKGKNIIVGCIYRHPSMEQSEFNDKTIILMNSLKKENKQVYMMGDFNIDLTKIENDNCTGEFFDIVTSHLFVPHIILPTRITARSKTLIDNIYSNSENFREGISGNITLSISDHLAQFLIIPYELNKKNKTNRVIYKRDFKNFDKENFILDFLDVDWNETLQLNKKDPNHSFTAFQERMNILMDKYIPLKRLTKKELQEKYKPWITGGIKKSIKRREQIYKKFIRAKDPTTKAYYHEQFKFLRTQIVNICRESKKQHYQQFFENNIHNLKNTWKGIKEIINIKNKNKGQINAMSINNEICNDPLQIANHFNNYFSSIASNLQTNIHNSGQGFEKYLKNPNQHSFFIQPTNREEVVLIISTLTQGKASGPNSLPNEILQMLKSDIAIPLAKILNLSFETGIYIDKLKISMVVPIFKENGSSLECSNYRPISLLSNLNKIFEKIMHKRLYEFLEKNECIFKNQFGFRKSHSTNHALINLTEDIRNSLDNGFISCGVFIDLRKAFDTVDHDILIKKLRHYGVRGIALDWFKSYLNNRRQFVTINGISSNELSMNYGVPQGSVLGPLLFLIYINDLNIAIQHSTVRHFADDTNLLFHNKNPKQLTKHMRIDLKNLCNWLRANKISLNASKTELLIFRSNRKVINYDIKIKIDGKKIVPSKFVKYLGLYIDCHLNWSFQCDVLATKLSRSAGMLSKIRHYVPKDTLRTIYYAIFSSILHYGSIIWGQAKPKAIKRIESIQNRAVRTINFAPFRSPTDCLYQSSKILKFSDQVKLQDVLLIHDYLNKRIPIALLEWFQFNPAVSQHDYPSSGARYFKMEVPRINNVTYGEYSISFQAIKHWNHLVTRYPQEKLHTVSKDVIREFMQKKILESYL